MIGIGKNRYKTLVTITALASVLIINAITTGTDGHIALARHHDNTKVFENNMPFLFSFPIDTNQRQACTTAGGTSPISDSCTASSSDTVSRGTASPSCPTIHPTALTLTISPTTVGVSQPFTLTGTLTDTCTGSGVPGATIGFSGTVAPPPAVTNGAGSYSTTGAIGIALGPTSEDVQAQFAGQGIFGPSNSATQTFTVT
jgi:hypothetical protein